MSICKLFSYSKDSILLVCLILKKNGPHEMGHVMGEGVSHVFFTSRM